MDCRQSALEWLELGAAQFQCTVCLWNLASLASSAGESLQHLRNLRTSLQAERRLAATQTSGSTSDQWLQINWVDGPLEERVQVFKFHEECQQLHLSENRVLLKEARTLAQQGR